MSQIAQQILSLAKQLMPKGRAFRIPPQGKGTGYIYTDMYGNYLTDMNGNFIVSPDWTRGKGGFLERFLKGFGGDGGNRRGTLERCYNDATSILGHILPINGSFNPGYPGFTDGTINPNDNDCNDWEGRLGLMQWGVTSATTPSRLQRMAAIGAKMAYPGTDAPRQSAAYLQAMLQLAGFPLYVYENLSGHPIGSVFPIAMCGAIQCGQAQCGQKSGTSGNTKVVNNLNPAVDNIFVIPSVYSVFFISGNPITTRANIPAIQQAQLRQLILNLKPAQLVGITFINFT